MARKHTWSGSIRTKVDALKRAIDLRDLFAERYPGRFRRSGRWLIGPSPYRRDEHPSFGVNEDVFIDFATGERGDEVDFVRREQGASFSEAVETLEAIAGNTTVPERTKVPQWSPSPSEPPPASWQSVMREECQHARSFLLSGVPDAQQALNWLQRRGLHMQVLREAGIGFNPAWRRTRLRDYATGRSVSIPPGVLIPCVVDGALWAVHVRTLPDVNNAPNEQTEAGDKPSLPKYLYVRGSKASALYNGDALEDGDSVLLVEGEFDALLAQQELGKQVVVVTIGSAANHLPGRWVERLKRARHVYSCLDSDEAGQQATARLAELFGEQHRALQLPQGKDITEFVVDNGGNLRQWWRSQMEAFAPKPEQLSFLDRFALIW
jgi:DNA primase